MFPANFIKKNSIKIWITAFSVMMPLALHAANTMTPQARATATARAADLETTRKNPRFVPAATRQKLQSLALKSTQTRAAASSTGSKSTSPRFQSQTERILKPIRQSLIAKAKNENLNTHLTPNTASTSGNLAVNFPGFQRATSVFGGNPQDPNLVWVSMTADVNKDGKPDIITVQNDGSVNVLLNPGTGSLSSFAVTSTNTTAMQYGVEFVYGSAVDLNQDGYPDLELLDVVNNAVFVYMNKKDGTFSDPVMNTVTFNNGQDFNSYGGSAVFADVNGDKIPYMISTIATPSQSGPTTTFSVQVAIGNGDGTFAAPLPEQDSTINAFLTTSYGQVVTADIDKDGKQDLVYLTGGNDANYNSIGYAFPVLGNGDGTFASVPSTLPTTGGLVVGVYPTSVASLAVSDMNGDGLPDILFSLGDGNLYTALGTGTATPQNATAAGSGLSTAEIGGPPLVSFADVNGDGIVDAISYNYGFIAVYTGTKTGTFSTTALTQLIGGNGGEIQPLPADFDGDGHVDLAQVDYASLQVGFYPGANLATAGAPAIAATGESAQSLQVLSQGDFNGDGFPDILATDFNNVPVYNPFGGFAVHALNDGELQTDETQPNLVIGTNDGKGNFTYTVAVTSAIGLNNAVDWVAPVSVDLNGDGKADIVMGAAQGIGISLSKPDGTYTNPTIVTLPLPTRCTVSAADIGDLNGDGFPDIVATYPGDASCDYTYNDVPTPSGFFVLLNDKTGNFTATFVPYGFGSYLPKLADMNGDGKLDLLISDSGTGGLGYYFYALPGNGDGTFNLANATQPLEATVVTAIIPGDFDGDGKMDLALGVLTQVDANGKPVYNTTGVDILKGNGDFTFALPVQYAPGTYPVDGKAVDFNGDGRPDLALNMVTYDYYTDISTTNFVYMPNLGGGGFGAPIQAFGPQAPGNIFTADFNGDGAIDVISSGLVEDLSGMSGLYWNLGAMKLAIQANATSTSQSSPVTLTATLTPGLNSATPTGTVTFYDNGSVLGIVPVSSTTAALTANLATVGVNSITATYSGDSNFNGASSTPLSITVTALSPAFTLAPTTSATASVAQGQTSVLPMTLTANAAFAGTVSLTCSGAPSESTCTVSPASVALGTGQSSTLSVVIATTAPNNVSEAANRKPSTPFAAMPVSFGGIGMICIFGLRRRRALLMKAGVCMLALVALIASLGLTGCSGSSTPAEKYQGTPLGTSTITVTATSGSLTQTQAITLTVTQ